MKRLIDPRFLFTPYATTLFRYGDITRKYYYIFGFKIMDLVQ